MTDNERVLAQQILDRLQEMDDTNDVIRSEIRAMARESREAGERIHRSSQDIQREMKEFREELEE
jgi:hypothetical protein